MRTRDGKPRNRKRSAGSEQQRGSLALRSTQACSREHLIIQACPLTSMRARGLSCLSGLQLPVASPKALQDSVATYL